MKNVVSVLILIFLSQTAAAKMNCSGSFATMMKPFANIKDPFLKLSLQLAEIQHGRGTFEQIESGFEILKEESYANYLHILDDVNDHHPTVLVTVSEPQTYWKGRGMISTDYQKGFRKVTELGKIEILVGEQDDKMYLDYEQDTLRRFGRKLGPSMTRLTLQNGVSSILDGIGNDAYFVGKKIARRYNLNEDTFLTIHGRINKKVGRHDFSFIMFSIDENVPPKAVAALLKALANIKDRNR